MEKLELLKEVEILRKEFYNLNEPRTTLLVEDLYSLIFASNSAVAASIRHSKARGIGRNKKRALELDSLRAEIYYYRTFIEFVKKYDKKIKKQ